MQALSAMRLQRSVELATDSDPITDSTEVLQVVLAVLLSGLQFTL